MEKYAEYVVLSHKNFADIMRLRSGFSSVLPYKENQGEKAWVKKFGLYLRPMVHLNIFPTNQTLAREREIPTLFGAMVCESGIMHPELYGIINLFLKSPDSFGCVFRVSDNSIMAKVDMAHDSYNYHVKVKFPVKEIVSFSRQLSAEEFGAMDALREI